MDTHHDMGFLYSLYSVAVVHNWWSDDQAEFKNFCDQLPDGEFRQMTLGAASYAELSQNPFLAIDWAQQMSPGDRQAGLLQACVEQWMQKDPNAALDWLSWVGDPNLHER